MPSSFLSVLMPVYNAAETLPAALESLASQTIERFEIVAVDDGSDDGSGEILRRWAAKDPRLRIVSIPHRGLIDALNAGLEACKGTFVARMDADDLAHPRRLEKQAALLENAPDVSVVGCLVETFPRNAVKEGFRVYEEWLNSLVSHEEIAREIFVESPIAHPSALMRRAELLEIGGYQDRGWPEDYDLWLRYFTAGRRFAKVAEKLLRWREHPFRLTHTDRRYSVENFLRAKAHYLVRGPLRERDGLIVWGAGKTGRRLSKHLIRQGRPPDFFVDIDPRKIGGGLRGVPIAGAEALPGLWKRWRRPLLLAAVASRGARTQIRKRAAEMGLVEGEDFLCVA